jgi:pimeloyl-ACP methyl ester carboxylesterase
VIEICQTDRPPTSMHTIASAKAGPEEGIVLLRESLATSSGDLLLVIPGMEGSGESCIEVVMGVLSALGTPYRLVLVDYSQERCGSFEELSEIIHSLAHKLVCTERAHVRVWAQSFGNLLALSMLDRGDITVESIVLVSPFTALPIWKVTPAVLTMKITPTSIYRLSIGPIGRLVFGPVGDRPNHSFFEAMRRSDAPTMARRMGWLQKRSFFSLFEGNRWPSQVYLGLADRLIALQQQHSYFLELAVTKGNYSVTGIPGSGHVIIPTNVVHDAVQNIASNWPTQ